MLTRKVLRQIHLLQRHAPDIFPVLTRGFIRCNENGRLSEHNSKENSLNWYQ